jgi:2-hydroxychromene-2-carboxylate isomerase
METVRFHFDPRCPWCYQTSRWARRLHALGEVDVDWGVFSLSIANSPEGTDPKSLGEAPGAEVALRTAILVRDTEGRHAVGKFYEALGLRVWETVPPAKDDEMADAVRASLTEAGLDPGLCDKALGDPGTWDAVIEEHQDIVERFGAFGVPTIVLDGGAGPAIFGPVVAKLPSDEEAVELWRHSSWMVRYDNFYELKRNRTSAPDLPAMAWRMEQRRAKEAAEKAEKQA